MGEGTERNTESTVLPTDEAMYGALTRVAQTPSNLVAGNARQVHRNNMLPDDSV
jgi:hypothetical protein